MKTNVVFDVDIHVALESIGSFSDFKRIIHAMLANVVLNFNMLILLRVFLINCLHDVLVLFNNHLYYLASAFRWHYMLRLLTFILTILNVILVDVQELKWKVIQLVESCK